MGLIPRGNTGVTGIFEAEEPRAVPRTAPGLSSFLGPPRLSLTHGEGGGFEQLGGSQNHRPSCAGGLDPRIPIKKKLCEKMDCNQGRLLRFSFAWVVDNAPKSGTPRLAVGQARQMTMLRGLWTA